VAVHFVPTTVPYGRIRAEDCAVPGCQGRGCSLWIALHSFDVVRPKHLGLLKLRRLCEKTFSAEPGVFS